MRKSVLILGGGIAGLSAARALVRENVSVTLLEAQNRFGGRIRTVHHEEIPIELGAEFIHGESKPLLDAVRKAKLPVKPVPMKSRLHDNGHLRNVNIWEKTGEIFNRMGRTEKDLPFDDFLARQNDLDDRTRNMMRHYVEGFNAADASRISVKALYRAERAAEQMNGSRQFRIMPGYSALIDFMARDIEKCGGTLLKGASVRQITWRHGAVSTLAAHDNRMEIFESDAAVITFPLGVLKAGAVTFIPPVPGKMEAVRNLEFGNVMKIIFQFRSSFWDDFGFIHVLDGPIPTWWPDSRGPIITGWSAGPHADALLKFSHAQLEETGLETLRKIFSVRGGVLRKQLVASHYWNWADDPHIHGAYSYIPVNGLALPQMLASPVAETLFFAGEATVADAQMGTVFGALETGIRAAQEALNFI